MKLTEEQKEEIEAELFSFYNLVSGYGNVGILKSRDIVNHIKEIAAPAIFKILEKGE